MEVPLFKVILKKAGARGLSSLELLLEAPKSSKVKLKPAKELIEAVKSIL
ncbi:MAG TPA: hypothetical protein PKE06_10420 [Flavilitoribacter sp.]|nr:hypothetical protein [Flavilitoribacter sp.]HMQ86278.1 hypothetical protein [Flavilitoribacter sp.]